MQILECPKCKQKMVKIYTRGHSVVSFLIKDATETVKCRNCGKKIAYSVKKVDMEVDNGRDRED